MSTLAAPLDVTNSETEGVSEDFFAVVRCKNRSYREYGETAITLVTPEQQFGELAATWKEETKFMSSVDDIVLHPAHLQILGMGPRVIPLIVRELQREPGHWFVALKALSGRDPVPDRLRGDVAGMAWAWINWAAANGI
jgi:hypothetical protein